MRAVTASASRQWLFFLLLAALACFLSACQMGLAPLHGFTGFKNGVDCSEQISGLHD